MFELVVMPAPSMVTVPAPVATAPVVVTEEPTGVVVLITPVAVPVELKLTQAAQEPAPPLNVA